MGIRCCILIISAFILCLPGLSWSVGVQPVSSVHICSDYSDIFVLEPYAYAATVWGLEILDISNPADPARIGEAPTIGEAMGVCVSNNYAYVADGYAGLQVIDVSDPTNPVAIGNVDTPGEARKVQAD
jgi:hypothetical protein